MSKGLYVALDTETGGIGPDVSLLTMYLAVLDENLDLVEELDLKLKPDNGIYSVTAEALTINRIDLTKHEDGAVTPGNAGRMLRELLIRHTGNGSSKLTPIGHNVAFDLEKIYQTVLNKKEAQKYVSYRSLDTGVVGRFLIVTGLVPPSVTGSLGSYADHFKVPNQDLHTARGDTITTVDVMKEMIKLVSPKT